MNKKVGWSLTLGALALLVARGLRQEIGNYHAGTNGVCVKARAYTLSFRSTEFIVEVDYRYRGKRYSGTVTCLTRIRSDSCYIKIDPQHPDYVAYAPDCMAQND
ncbi:hypothetical protein GCM10028824_35770 [Hymenobacter segetis]